MKLCWLHSATIFREDWSLSAWKLLPTRQLATKASHPMSPSYSGKLLMIALRDSSTILYKYAHTRTLVRCVLVHTYLWTNVHTSAGTILDFVLFVHSLALRGDLDQVLQRLVEFPRVSFSCWRKLPPVSLSYWTISLPLSPSLRRSFLSLQLYLIKISRHNWYLYKVLSTLRLTPSQEEEV